MRAKIATAILVLIGLVSIYQPIQLNRLRPSPENEVLVVLDRAQCIKDDLPQDVTVFGSLPAVDLIIHSKIGAFEIGNQLRRLFLMRHVVTPRLVMDKPNAPWVIGYFSSYEAGQQYLNETSDQGWEVVKDCQNGVFLLKHPFKDAQP